MVVSPIAFFALLIFIGLLYRRRVRRASAQKLLPGKGEEEAATPCSYRPPPNLLGLRGVDDNTAQRRPSIGLPHFKDKTISVRRMSAFPHMDEIKRVNSIASTLTDITAEQQERDRRGSTTTLIVTDMGEGHVGVERRPSIPESTDLVQQAASGSTCKDPGSPHDKRFSMPISYIVPPSDNEPNSQVDNNATMENLTTPMTIQTPIPARSPSKKKDRPDSIELAISRSPTLIKPHLPVQPVINTDAGGTASPHTEPGELFKGWTGFSPSPQLNIAQGLAVTTDDATEVTPPPRRSSLSAKRVSRITYLADVVKEEQARKGADTRADTEEVIVSPSKVALPQSPP